MLPVIIIVGLVCGRRLGGVQLGVLTTRGSGEEVGSIGEEYSSHVTGGQERAEEAAAVGVLITEGAAVP